MAVKARFVVGSLVWAGAAFGIVNLSHLPGDFEQSLCGPWG
jgi:hypothetical protein